MTDLNIYYSYVGYAQQFKEKCGINERYLKGLNGTFRTGKYLKV